MCRVLHTLGCLVCSFIRKVYGILTLQLLITFGITAIFVFSTTVQDWVLSHPGVLYSAIALQFVFIIILVCFRESTRVVPYNYLLLFGFTLAESYLIGAISSQYTTDSVLIAFGICMGVTAGLTIFACQVRTLLMVMQLPKSPSDGLPYILRLCGNVVAVEMHVIPLLPPLPRTCRQRLTSRCTAVCFSHSCFP